jgi:septum formation protein
LRAQRDAKRAVETGDVAAAPLVLASASPQRRAILERLGVRFVVRPQHVEEISHGDPREVARENALRKARAARAAGETGIVLGCDTLVALGGVIYGKPPDADAARATLRALSGATHDVLGGVALLYGAGEETGVACTEVTFRALDDATIEWYVGRGEWRGRAGGYAIQGAGAALVQGVRGDYENIVGLPLAMLLEMRPQLVGASTGVR